MDLVKNIVIFVNGNKYTVDSSKVTPQTTLNDYLRNDLLLTGTKRMCLEGGCGACIVSVSRINPRTEKLETFSVNSCLISIFSCYGWDIYTIEGLGTSNSPHPIQRVLTKFNGTQCGYCTPGMIMNMYALQKALGDLTMKEVDNSFGGNICRCTGYRPILSGFKSLCSDASSDLIDQCPDIEEINGCKNDCGNKCALSLATPFYFKLGQKIMDKMICFRLSNLFMMAKRLTCWLQEIREEGCTKVENDYDVYIDILNVSELLGHEINKDKVVLGANISLTDTMNLFYKLTKQYNKFKYLKKVADHIDLIANVPVRNAGTFAGNLMLKHRHTNFPSDIFLILETIEAQLQIVDINNKEYVITPLKFLKIDMSNKIIKKIIIPELDATQFYESYKIMPRAQNAHALVNAGYLLKIKENFTIQKAVIVYGWALKTLNEEISPDFDLADPAPIFRKNLAISLFYKYILSIAPAKFVSSSHLSGNKKLHRPVSVGTQDFETNKSLYPLSQPIPKIEAIYQTTGKLRFVLIFFCYYVYILGEAEYITDMPKLPNQLYAAFVMAKASPKKLRVLLHFLTKMIFPEKNTFTPKESGLPIEEEMFCSGTVQYHSQPVGIIFLLLMILLTKILFQKITQDKIIEPKSQGKNVKHVVEGDFYVSWQYHFHMETQCCNVIPKEDGLDMYAGTQWMDLAQNSAAAVLNIPANKINVVVRRLGGSFGAKIIRSALISSATALAAYKLKQPVKLWMPLETNMSVIGKRYPVYSHYEVTLDEKGVIQNLKNKFYYDQGSGGNEAVMFLTCDTYLGTYNTDTWYTDANIVNTDMHPSCYIRAPGK
ncbi:hypothetical protein NQ317_006247 [Molorchus minor]|uniref:Uncharacterized protein n=1 Tax=Molorchus minor TaxID=1323400 RepID=A0ABQ9K5Z2_9CUCU|nr:hypothetical protein NQ317_006247 [Molorchus minor]